MENYQTAKFDHSPKNLSRDILLTDRCPEKKKKKRIRKAKTIDLYLHADLNTPCPWAMVFYMQQIVTLLSYFSFTVRCKNRERQQRLTIF